jgi:hypothetical protein
MSFGAPVDPHGQAALMRRLAGDVRDTAQRNAALSVEIHALRAHTWALLAARLDLVADLATVMASDGGRAAG